MGVSRLELLIAGVLVVAAGALVFGQTRLPQSRPAEAARGFLAAAAAADLEAVREVSTAGLYGEIKLRISRPRFKAAQQVFDKVIPRLAESDWRRLWRKVGVLAGGEYERLHQDVARLGRRSFEELEATERMDLIKDRDRYEEFIYRKGVEALPLADSGRISSTAAFRARSDRDEFVANEGWKKLSDEDRALLGGPKALAGGTTPEKLAFYDRVAIPKLDAGGQAAIAGISREDVATLPHFAAKHGERLLLEALGSAGLTTTDSEQPCVFPREEGGSLFRGPEASCGGFLASLEGSAKVVTKVQKAGFQWLVAGVSDEFFTAMGRS